MGRLFLAAQAPSAELGLQTQGLRAAVRGLRSTGSVVAPAGLVAPRKGDLPGPESPAVAGGFFATELPGKPLRASFRFTTRPSGNSVRQVLSLAHVTASPFRLPLSPEGPRASLPKAAFSAGWGGEGFRSGASSLPQPLPQGAPSRPRPRLSGLSPGACASLPRSLIKASPRVSGNISPAR